MNENENLCSFPHGVKSVMVWSRCEAPPGPAGSVFGGRDWPRVDPGSATSALSLSLAGESGSTEGGHSIVGGDSKGVSGSCADAVSVGIGVPGPRRVGAQAPKSRCTFADSGCTLSQTGAGTFNA